MKTTDVIYLNTRINKLIRLMGEENCPTIIKSQLKDEDIIKVNNSVDKCFNELISISRWLEGK